MLSYAEQARMTDYLVAIYDQIELELMENLIAAIKKTKYGGATEWRAQMLERMGWYNKKNVAAIARKTGKTQQEIRQIFKDLGLRALTHEETLYQTAFDRGLLPTRPVNLAESAAISQILDAAIGNAECYLNLVNTTCEEAAKSAYMDVVNKAYIETITGVKDYNTAIRHAVNNLAKNGLATVTYYRKDGKKINYPVDAAVRRNIMTSIGQTTGKMQLARAEEWGCNYMEVTSHFGARPSHAEWQGQVYMINGSSNEYKNLAEATGYGTGEGLKGWNCRHDMYPFIPGVSVRGSFPVDLKENEAEYRLTQQQRALEREVRQLRRECVAANGLGDKAEFTRKSMELKDKEAELKDFIVKTNRTQAARVSTAGYNRSVSGKVTWTVKKELKKADGSGIMKNENIADRNMANGMRKSAKIKLSDSDKQHLLSEIDIIKADRNVFVFRDGFGSGYSDERDKIFVSSNIFPSNDGSKHPRDLMSERAALAHEYYGHRAYRGTKLPKGSWNDEFRASYMAAKNCPNLTDEDRYFLILDALERAKESGISIQYNSFIRSILYGY